MNIENEVKLDFQDVLIRPKRSQASSRSEVDITRRFIFKNSKRTWEGVPIIATNMDTIATFRMARTLIRNKICTCLCKHYPLDDIVEFLNSLTVQERDFVFYTTGVTDKDFERLVDFKLKTPLLFHNICVDVANGYTDFFLKGVKTVRSMFPNAIIIAGNVATPEIVQELILSGAADIVKVGIGPGSVCITRKVAGIGYPQLSAVIETADAAHGIGGHIISDGGCTTSGDVAKAFGGGADFVMLGGMLAGHDECDGVVENNEMSFYGMSSKEAMDKYNGGIASYKASEGKCVKVPYKGSVENTIQDILGGLRSACTYVGAMKLKDLSKCTTFIKVNRTHNTIYGNSNA